MMASKNWSLGSQHPSNNTVDPDGIWKREQNAGMQTNSGASREGSLFPHDDDHDAVSKNARLLLAVENQKLREKCRILSNRQEMLEEYLELEMSAEAIQRYKNNKKRMIYAMQIQNEEVAAATWEGRRSPKYLRMLTIIKHATDYWKHERINKHRPSNRDARLCFENGVPPDLAELRLHVNFDSGLICRKPVKRCNTCYDESHEQKTCPYKHNESRTPEVVAMIQQRVQHLKEVEGNDPLISAGYKQRHYKINSKRLKNR